MSGSSSPAAMELEEDPNENLIRHFAGLLQDTQGVTGLGFGPGSQQAGRMNQMNMQQHLNAEHSQSNYVKIWEGTLSGQRQGEPVFICNLKGYRSVSASDTLAADWPAIMQISRLVAQEHMSNSQYVGNADFLVFRTLNQHEFLEQLQERKLIGVIQLPSQTLLLSVSYKAGRLIGMLIPGESIRSPHPTTQQTVFPQISQDNNIMQQHLNAQLSQSKYVKIWEGTLSGQRQGQPVFICRLESYRKASASDTLAADWPATMQIFRLIAQEHMNNKEYVDKADFLVFRTFNQHEFLGQLQEKKLCAVIQLPSQTLLLSVSEKAGRLIGLLFSGDMVFRPQVFSSQQPQMQPQPQQPQMQLQQPPPQQQMQQNPMQQQQMQQNQMQQNQMQQNQMQQNQMMGGGSMGMGQPYSSSFMRFQVMPPQSNKPPNSLSGPGGFM